MPLLLILFNLLSPSANAARAVMEGIKATNNTVFFDTGTARTNLNAAGYSGGLSNVGVNIASNVVVSNVAATNKCVIYSSGSIACIGTVTGSANPAAGDVVSTANNTLSGNNRFSGNNTFSGTNSLQGNLYINATSTIGPQGYSNSVVKSSGTLNNIWMVVASTNPSSQTAISFASLSQNRWYRLHYNIKGHTGDGIMQLNFNSSSQNAWAFSTRCGISNGGEENAASAGTSAMSLDSGVGVAQDTYGIGDIEFMNGPSTTTMNVNGLSLHWANTAAPPIMLTCKTGGVWTGNATATSVQLSRSGGNPFTGYVYLEEFLTPNP